MNISSLAPFITDPTGFSAEGISGCNVNSGQCTAQAITQAVLSQVAKFFSAVKNTSSTQSKKDGSGETKADPKQPQLQPNPVAGCKAGPCREADSPADAGGAIGPVQYPGIANVEWNGLKFGDSVGGKLLANLAKPISLATSNNANVITGQIDEFHVNDKVELVAGIGLGRLLAGLKPVSTLPLEMHHFATDKNKQFAPAMSKIAEKYGLQLDQPWNKQLMAHSGRHPNEYHQFVLDAMKFADTKAQGNTAEFLRLFNNNVRRPIMENPELLRKSGWQ